MAKLAVIVLTRNEEKNIGECIATAAFADEIIVVDSGSKDATVKTAHAAGAKVFNRPMDEAGFAGQRNFALTKTEAEWVFYLDADERILPETAAEIADIVQRGEKAAYRVKRYNIVFGQVMRHGEHAPDFVARLFPRECVTWYGAVHESPQTKLPQKTMKNALNHYTYTDWERYFEKFNNYTTLMAERMADEGKVAAFSDIIFHPLFAFIRFYFLRLGFLDGRQGFIFAVNHYFYTMIKYVKLYYKQREGGKNA